MDDVARFVIRANLISALAYWAKKDPDRPALQWMTDAFMTYGELYQEVQGLAAGFAAAGVKRGDTVLFLLPNSLEIIHAWLAINFLGATEVPVNVHDRGSFLEHVVNDSRASVMVVHASLIERIVGLEGRLKHLQRLVVVGSVPTENPFGYPIIPFETLSAPATPIEAVAADNRDLMAVFYTSGTTGPAKGVMFTYGQASLCATNLINVMELAADDVYFVCMPLFHSNAQIIQVMPALLVGARVSVWPGFNASSWLDDIRAVGATVSNTLGVMCQYIFDQPARIDDPRNPLRCLQTIPLPKAIAHRFEERFGVACVDGYGLTDVGMVTYRRLGEPLVPGGSGQPVSGYEVRVADPETDEPLLANAIGEILIRPTAPLGFMAGYWNNPAATVAAWRNLWFHTGDAGYFDERGELFFHDRIKDSIRVRGENVSSSQVEAEFLKHPAVADCAAVAVPGDRGDDEIKICVVVRTGHTVMPEELLDHCAPNMPYFAVPRYVEFIAELPKTPTGKIRKVDLRRSNAGAETWDRKKSAYLVPR